MVGCTECCWWLYGYFALAPPAEAWTSEQEKLILRKLNTAVDSIDTSKCFRDVKAEAIVKWLLARMETFAELDQRVPAQIVQLTRSKLIEYAGPGPTKR